MNENTRLVSVGNITFRVRLPTSAGGRKAILMLHGWTGDENAMWIFAKRLPTNYWLLAPRGIVPAPFGGYAWHPHRQGIWPTVNDLYPAVEALLKVLTPEYFPEIDFTLARGSQVSDRPLQLIGFSQGAAMAFTFGLLHPEIVRAIAGLSGFLPTDADQYIAQEPLRNVPVLLAHGTQDELVPVEKARQAAELLTRAGAQVDYCEDFVGHKLSATCFRSLEVFFQDLSD